MKVNFAVWYGLGIGCHREWLPSLKQAGANAELVHINEILRGEKDIRKYDVTIGPGGFTYGDMLGAGRPFATKLETALVPVDGKLRPFMELFKEYINQGGMFYGQCNFFQILSQLGALPGWDGNYTKPAFSLTTNKGIERYYVDFILHRVNQNSPCQAFKGLDTIVLSCRHGEGCVTFRREYGQISEQEAEANRKRMHTDNNILLWYADKKTGQPTMRFPDNPNGSTDSIAAVTDQSGRVFATMGHIEAITLFQHEDGWYRKADELRRKGLPTPDKGKGMQIIENIIKAAKGER